MTFGMNWTTGSPHSTPANDTSFQTEHCADYLEYGDMCNDTALEADDLSDIFEQEIIRSIFGIVIGTLGLPTTLILLAVTLTPSYRKHSYSLYLSAMCVYDFIFVLINFTESVLFLTQRKGLRDVLLWEAPCRLYEYLWYTSMTISIWLNVAVTVDRYVVIAFTFQKDRWCTRRNSWILTLGLVLFVHAIGSVFIVYGKVQYFPEDDSFYCEGEDILHDIDTFMGDLASILPAIIFIFIFTAMTVVKLSILKAERNKMTSQPISSRNKGSRTTLALMAISLCCIVTQVPYMVDEIIFTYAYHNDKNLYNRMADDDMPVYHIALSIFQSIKWIYNIQNFFILYALSHQFRKDVFNLVWHCGRRRKHPQRPTNNAMNTTGNVRMHATVTHITSVSR